MSAATCSKCRKAEPYVKFRGALLCVPCLIGASMAGVPGAEKLVAMIHRRAAKRRFEQQRGAS